MLVFGAICPHSPVLIPAIGKENTQLFPKTLEAYKTLKARLAEAAPEVLVIITSHGEVAEDKFILPSATEFEVSFEEFGDLATKFKVAAATTWINNLREALKSKANIGVVNQEKLDYGSGVPLFYLNQELKCPVVVVNQAAASRQAHWELGRLLGEEFLATEMRIAVVASGELSHCLNENAPGGYNPQAKTFDNRVVEILTHKKTEDILNMKDEEIAEIKECGLKSMMVLLGVFAESEYESEFLAYENPLGVGCLSLNFKIED